MKYSFLLFFLFFSLLSQAQITVDMNDNVGIGTSDPLGAKLMSKGVSQFEFAVNADTGNSDFTYMIADQVKGQIKYLFNQQGITYNLDANSTGATGIGQGRSALYLSAINLRVGVNTINPQSTLDVNGSIRYNGSLTNASDSRLKSNITSLQSGLETILALNPIMYQYNGKAGLKTKEKHVGIIAQDLQVVAPELVSTWEYIAYKPQTVEDVNLELPLIKESSEEYLVVNESAIKYVLVNAVKEQQKLIEEQRQLIKKQEKRIARLESLYEQIVLVNQ